jgi:hypothetical protein
MRSAKISARLMLERRSSAVMAEARAGVGWGCEAAAPGKGEGDGGTVCASE